MKKQCEAPGCVELADYLVEISDDFFKLKTQKFSCSTHLVYFDGEKETLLREQEN